MYKQFICKDFRHYGVLVSLSTMSNVIYVYLEEIWIQKCMCICEDFRYWGFMFTFKGFVTVVSVGIHVYIQGL